MAQTRREPEEIMNVDALTAAIGDYFRGERQEMLAILACSTGLLLLAAALHAVGRDGFSRGFGLTALLLAVMLSSTAGSLLLRDPPHQARLVAALQGTDARAVLAGEAARMAEVIRKYPYYRNGALALGLLALAGAALSRIGWVAGAAAGVLLLVVAQLTIDHYSEARATRYAGQLGAALVAPVPARPR
jgi:hypothetical protein